MNRRARAAFAGLLLLAASCGEPSEPPVVNSAVVEAEVTDGIREQLGVQVTSVVCPDDVEVEEGGTFSCVATDEHGNSAFVSVTQSDDQGNVTWQVAAFATDELETQIMAGLTEQTAIEVDSVQCPEVVLQGEGNVFRCVVTSAGESASVRVEQTDDQGNVDWVVE